MRSVLLLCLLILALGACAPEHRPADAGVLVVTEEQSSSYVRNFNPFLGGGRRATNHAMYEPLLIYNTPQGKYVPWLASAWKWGSDQLTLDFTLRSGVKWSDGQPLTPEDVAFSFELLKQKRALDIRGIWKFVANVEATASGVRFTLQRRYVPGLFYISQQPIVPKHVWKDIDDPVSHPNHDPVASGPFTEINSFRTQVYEVGRNPHYWQQGKPAVKALRFPAFPANDQSNLALINGELDWAGNFVPAIDRIFVGKNPTHHKYWFPLIQGTVMLYANTTKQPFDQVGVRKALSMAIDRELLVQVAMYDYTRPADATALSDAYARFRDEKAVEDGDWVRHDPTRASQLLEQAGLKTNANGQRLGPHGQPLSVNINVVAGWSDWVRAVQVIARGLKRVGIDAKIKTYDFSAWFQKIQKGEFDLSIGWSEEGPTPYSLYRGLMSAKTVEPVGEVAGVNWHRFADARADELLSELETAADEETQKRIVTELQRRFVELAPAIPLFPNPAWGEFNTTRFTGFPNAENPYASLTPNKAPESLLVLTELKPR